ncbi:MAG: hypothetical protein JSV17_00995 [Candidatus Aminicenantes bacterium]|nr:MAG: hypothetical protein JSV17_00995 [Candidatus Aminicenantes bacterium]
MTLKSCRLIRNGALIILLSGLIPCNPFPSWQEAENPVFQKGMAFPTWVAEQYGTAESDESLRILAQTTCTEYVQLVPTWYQENRFSDLMIPDYEGRTARMDYLRHAINTVHNLGLKVMLKPHVDAFNGDWRGTFQPENPEIWFSNYTSMLKTYAQVAKEQGVDIFSVGCEFVELTIPNFTQNWKEVIQEVRNVFDGPLIYAANWGRESLQVEFWDALDYIGIDAYFGLTEKFDLTIDELVVAWRPFVTEIESVHLTWQKPVILTEIGYRSINGTNRQPWDWEASGEVDLEEQALCYQAVIQVFGEKTWFGGIYWWNWEPDPTLGGPTDNYYTPQGKPAEAILKRWYCGKKGSIRR